MNLFLLWRPDLYDDYLFGILFVSYYLFILILILSSYGMKDLWVKRFMRYYTPVSLLFLKFYFNDFFRVEEGIARISEYHIVFKGPPIIRSNLDLFFTGIEVTSLLIAIVSLLFFSLFKVFGIVLRKFRSRS